MQIDWNPNMCLKSLDVFTNSTWRFHSRRLADSSALQWGTAYLSHSVAALFRIRVLVFLFINKTKNSHLKNNNWYLASMICQVAKFPVQLLESVHITVIAKRRVPLLEQAGDILFFIRLTCWLFWSKFSAGKTFQKSPCFFDESLLDIQGYMGEILNITEDLDIFMTMSSILIMSIIVNTVK